MCAGECFCLLGPNGAGKSTTINCLTGVLPATAGDAVVHGSSITHQGGLNRVRGVMGVCTQFDVLWDNLTGREHLLLFGAIKGLSRTQAEKQADALLDQVSIISQATMSQQEIVIVLAKHARYQYVQLLPAVKACLDYWYYYCSDCVRVTKQ